MIPTLKNAYIEGWGVRRFQNVGPGALKQPSTRAEYGGAQSSEQDITEQESGLCLTMVTESLLERIRCCLVCFGL